MSASTTGSKRPKIRSREGLAEGVRFVLEERFLLWGGLEVALICSCDTGARSAVWEESCVLTDDQVADETTAGYLTALREAMAEGEVQYVRSVISLLDSL